MRLNESIVVSAPPKLVWDYIADPDNALHFMSGVTRWEVEGEQRTGLGARYRMLMRVGSAEIGGLVEVVEFDEPRDMAWSSVTGVDQRGRWRLRTRRRTAAPGSSSASPTASPAPGIAGLHLRARSPRPLDRRHRAPAPRPRTSSSARCEHERAPRARRTRARPPRLPPGDRHLASSSRRPRRPPRLLRHAARDALDNGPLCCSRRRAQVPFLLLRDRAARVPAGQTVVQASSRLRTLPVALRGSESRNSTSRGTL